MISAFVLPRQLGVGVPIAARAAAWSLAVAGGAHLAALPAHRDAGIAVTLFFLTTAIVQVAAATTILRRAGTSVRAIIVAGNVSLLALWVWSRTVGIPIGSHHGLPESSGPLDITAVFAQVVAIGAVLVLSRTRDRAPIKRPRSRLEVVIVLSALGVALLLSTYHQDEHHEPRTPIANTRDLSTGGSAADNGLELVHSDQHSHP